MASTPPLDGLGTMRVQAKAEKTEPTAFFLPLLTEGINALTALVAGEEEAGVAWQAFVAKVRGDDPQASPLADLVARCGLSDFALKCVLLALSGRVATPGREVTRPMTFGQAGDYLGSTDEGRSKAYADLRSDAPLLKHHIIDAPAEPIHRLTAPMVLTDEALRFLMGEPGLSPGLAEVAHLSWPRVAMLNVILDPRYLDRTRELVENHPRYRGVVREWGLDQSLPHPRGVPMLLAGPSGTGKSLLASALASHVGRPMMSISAVDLPGEGISAMLRKLFAVATMRDALVVLDHCEAVLGDGAPQRSSVIRAIAEHEGITILITSDPRRLDVSIDSLVAYQVRFALPDPRQRHAIWEVHLPPEVPIDPSVDLAALATLYDFTGAAIKNAVTVAIGRALADAPGDPRVTMAHLEDGCKMQLGYVLDDLTVRSKNPLRFEDVVLNDEAHEKLVEIIAAIRHRSVVMNDWGFGDRLVTGKGIAILLDGPPGTGKTLCAEVIGREFNSAIHRVNLPEIVSKWVGETEKHIQEVFQAARVSHAMLLFDEADALFASRSAEPRSSTDRYANMEVNLLLQEIERFPGVCILTTNSYGVLDRALVRRIQFRVTLLEPNVAQRERIWRVLCPSRVPLAADVDFAKLAKRYEMTGGLIKNVFLRAAYRAAREGSPVTQAILHDSCHAEFVASGKLTRDPGYIPPPRRR